MYKHLNLITKVDFNGFSTCYLYFKERKILLPIMLNETNPNPSTINTLIRLIYAMGGKYKNIKIYKQDNDVYYTYLSIYYQRKVFDININFGDAIKIAIETKIPIFATEEIINRSGFEVTKELVKKALLSQNL